MTDFTQVDILDLPVDLWDRRVHLPSPPTVSAPR